MDPPAYFLEHYRNGFRRSGASGSASYKGLFSQPTPTLSASKSPTKLTALGHGSVAKAQRGVLDRGDGLTKTDC